MVFVLCLRRQNHKRNGKDLFQPKSWCTLDNHGCWIINRMKSQVTTYKKIHRRCIIAVVTQRKKTQIPGERSSAFIRQVHFTKKVWVLYVYPHLYLPSPLFMEIIRLPLMLLVKIPKKIILSFFQLFLFESLNCSNHIFANIRIFETFEIQK